MEKLIVINNVRTTVMEHFHRSACFMCNYDSFNDFSQYFNKINQVHSCLLVTFLAVFFYLCRYQIDFIF